MKTDDLVTLLATGAGTVEPNAAARRYATALGWGAFGATLLMAITLGVRPDLDEAVGLPMFWVKLAFPAALALGGVVAASRLAHPGMRLGRVPLALAAPVLAMWVIAAYVLAGATGPARAELVLGGTWDSCLFYIAALSAPVFVAALWAMKGLAPTRPAQAGAASGLLAGAIGAMAYALHCPEMAAPFLGTWYLAGMLIPAAIGASLGPWLLRW
jgi:hypothetical protein